MEEKIVVVFDVDGQAYRFVNCDGRTNDNEELLISLTDNPDTDVAIFAPGQWRCAYRESNIKKA
jgi:hypothetical protein